MRITKMTFLLIAAMLVTSATAQTDKWNSIKNDIFWNTRDGSPIYSQGGGIFKFKDANGAERYYWYGAHYREAELYRQNPAVTQSRNMFEAVTCYSSTDLTNWTFEANAMTKEEMNRNSWPTWVGRLGVAFVSEIGKYALVVQHGARVLFAVSDAPTGPFVKHNEISMEAMIGTSNTGDQTVFTDEDTGKSYLVYSYGRGRNRIYISEIGVKDGKVDLLDCTEIFKGEGREGNCLFKYKGKFYVCASNLYGWDSSLAYWLVADDIRGPYLPKNDMKVMRGCEQDYAHVTQTGFFYTLRGSKQETVLYCGDRWADFAGNGLGYNQWVPLSFEGVEPYFNSLESWQLNPETGEWRVADDNNYVRNGSFEADRKYIPSDVKPVQDELMGWKTTILKGHKVAVRDSLSPVLNYFNTESDRAVVIGEKSLNMSDKIPFSRTVTQTITSTPFVALPDGEYRLTAKIKNTDGFDRLEMFAQSANRTFSTPVKQANPQWQSITLDGVRVSNGKVEIGFRAEGHANASCQVDDVRFEKITH